MAPRRLWFVIPNDLKEGNMRWTEPGQALAVGDDRAFAQPAPRRRGDPEVGVPQADPGYGFNVNTADVKGIMAFTTKTKAEEYAKDMAGKNPQKLFGVYGVEELFETTTPQIITKTFNDSGELVLQAEG